MRREGGVGVTVCAFCKGALDETRGPRCPLCSARHHLMCWEENGGCAQFACDAGHKEVN